MNPTPVPDPHAPEIPEAAPVPRERFAIRRPVTTAMLFLTLIVFGFRSYQQLPINLMPDISYPTLTVRTEYEGAAPEDVEKLVTRPLEEMLSIVSGMEQISSVSSPGISEVILEFAWGTDMNIAMQDVRDRLDLFDPPREVTEKPVILRYDPTLDPVMRVAITPGEMPTGATDIERQSALTAIREAAERFLKSDLEAEVGVAQVAVKGGREEEIQVLVDTDRLKSLGLSLENVVNALAQQNINLSGGRLQEGKTEYLVRTLNEFATVGEIGQSIVAAPAGQPIKLDDVARVFLGTKERDTIVHIDGAESVEIEIFKEGDANTVQVANRVKDLLGLNREVGLVERAMTLREAYEAVRKAQAAGETLTLAAAQEEILARQRAQSLASRLPSNISLNMVSDQSRFIRGSIEEVQEATIVGGLLALIVLFFFLRELRSTFIIGIAIPISVIAAFVPMYMGGLTLNIMSLGGLALGVGMLVDNSIVVLESIFRCREEGDDLVAAADRGTREVASAVTASTLTTVAVFFPIAFVEGVAGQIFRDLALTVTFSLLASLLTALFLIPMVVSRRSQLMQAERQVIWPLRAYREGRENGSVLAALAGVLPRGLGYASAGVRRIFVDTFGPPLAAIRRPARERSVAAFFAAFGGLLLFVFNIPVVVLLLALNIVAQILVTLLFVICLVVIVLWLSAAKILNLLLWLPLKIFDLGFDAFRHGYRLALVQSLRFGPVLLLVVLGFSLHAGYVARDLGQELIPPMRQGEFGIRLEAPPGTRLEDTEARAKNIETIIRARPEVETVTVEIGSENASRATTDRAENVAEFTVRLKSAEDVASLVDLDALARRFASDGAPPHYQDLIIDDLRRAIGQVSTEDISFTLPTLFSFKTAIELQIVGDDLNTLRGIGQRALAAMETIPGLTDTELSVKPGYPEVIIELDRELLASKGLSPAQVAERLRREVQGEVPTRFNSGGEKVDIRVRTDQTRLRSVEDLRTVAVSEGTPPIPLSAVATIRVEEGPSEIRRIDQRQVVLISANVEGRDLGAVSDDILRAVSKVDHPREYAFVLGGQNRELQVSYSSLQFALILAVFLVYVVMACQFESIWHPALVMFSVPLAFVGVIYVLDWRHIDLSIMVFLGGIILAGIVVNNAIVLVDYINQLRQRGMKKHDAVVEAGLVRLRPILMTTITTVLGLIPMALSVGDGSELRQPMALTVMAGLTSSTILTLIVIPVIYNMFGGRDPA